MSHGIGTLTLYPQMKALWYGPKTKIEVKIRDTRRYTTHHHQDDILNRLAAAKAALDAKQGKL